MTQRRDLRTGRALWAESSGLGVPIAVPSQDIFTDVAVIGAGISGALMARELLRRGHDVVLLDRRLPLHGSTMASTALLQFEIDVPLSKLAERIGVRKANRAWRRSFRAVQGLADIVAHERIRCGFRQRSSLYLAGTEYGSRALRAEVDARERAGLPGRYVDRAELRSRYGIDRTGAIESTGNASADPAQLTAGLLRRVVAAGGRIFSPADVQDTIADGKGVVLGLASGQAVIARHAVFCTGYELLKGVKLDGHVVKSTWAMACHPVNSLPAWLRTTMVWEASDPYLYLRSTHDGRLVAGGEDEESATRHQDEATLLTKSHRILSKVETLLPTLSIVPSHVWAGPFGESPTGLPLIDRVPGLPCCFTVAGFGGNGITHSVIASEVIARAIDGENDPDREMFRVP